MSDPIDPAPSPYDQAVEGARRTVLMNFAATLKPRQHALVLLHYESEWDFAAIASAFGVSAPAVSQMHERIIGAFRQYLTGLRIHRHQL